MPDPRIGINMELGGDYTIHGANCILSRRLFDGVLVD